LSFLMEVQQTLGGKTLPVVGRVQSPSSINTFKRCPRKYFYQYITGLPTKKSIHLIKGSVIHEVLEDFFDIDISRFDNKTIVDELRIGILKLFLAKWQDHKEEIHSLDITNIEEHTNDCLAMLSSWIEWFLKKIEEKLSIGMSLEAAFQSLTPIREEEYVSDEHAVRGFIDAIHLDDGKVRVLDYKTTKTDDISDEYYVQLAIYAFLYRVRHGKLPDTVGLHFLRFGQKHLDVDEGMVDFARETIAFVHARTTSTEKKEYVKTFNNYCRFCDFYQTCLGDE
jgi:putative RecB family exonuclease